MKTLRVVSFTAALALACAMVEAAQDKGSSAAKPKVAAMPAHTMMNEADITWGDMPPGLPSGGKMAVLKGNPSAAGFFVVRMKAPDGYHVPAHWHPTAENLTVISGAFQVSMADKPSQAAAKTLTSGAFASMPAKMHHELWTKGESELQISGIGPFQITYLNPADDPRGAKK